MISIHVTEAVFPIELYGSLSPHTKFVSKNSMQYEITKMNKEQNFVDKIMVEVENILDQKQSDLDNISIKLKK
jgi:hypothetical protein